MVWKTSNQDYQELFFFILLTILIYLLKFYDQRE